MSPNSLARCVRFCLLLAVCLAFMPLARAQTLTTLYSFQGGSDGNFPAGGLFRDSAGNLYGTTEFGGITSQSCQTDCGTAFKLDPTGRKTTYRFKPGYDDGHNPASSLIAVGNALYGTSGGGFGRNGAVFKISNEGESIYDFVGGIVGSGPQGTLLTDQDGDLFGVTTAGGGVCRHSGCGVVFEFDPSGNETVLYAFKGGDDGKGPYAGLVRDAEGNLYGTTSEGGSRTYCSGEGCGTVFKLEGTNETVLYSFAEGQDGGFPLAKLAMDRDGNLFGTTYRGGNSACHSPEGCGVVFKLSAVGVETVLHTFGGGNDGAGPTTSVISDGNGGLYGTSSFGGSGSCGTIFRIDHKGRFSVLYGFQGPDGCSPQGDLITDSEGNIYGTTVAGGAFNSGTVFRLSPN